jgi:dihydrofolate synthase/folylpolyglutamate synthase
LASVAVCLEHFRRQAVEVGVVEVGVGGRDDLTNVLSTAIAVVTNVGLDHQRTLGESLDQIAEHKAGIIHPGCRAVIYAQSTADPLYQAADRRAKELGASLRVVGPEHVSIRTDRGRCRVTFRGRHLALQDAQVAMPGVFQGLNAALALAACEELDPSGDSIGPAHARQGLRTARLPARLEVITPDTTLVSASLPCRVVLDGAHNADKLVALTQHLVESNDRPRRLHLIYGALDSKTHQQVGARLARLVSSVTVTEPRVYAKQARPAAEAAKMFETAFDGPIEVCPDPTIAVDHTLQRARPDDWVVVTGSLYLAGNLRNEWFPDRDVVAQQTSWPSPPTGLAG